MIEGVAVHCSDTLRPFAALHRGEGLHIGHAQATTSEVLMTRRAFSQSSNSARS
jgi:hypothetical protein